MEIIPETVRRVRQRLEYNSTGLIQAAAGALTITAQNMSRTRTVTRRGDSELTRTYERCGKKRSERERVMRHAVANRVSVYWGFKGLGQAFGYGFYNLEKYSFQDPVPSVIEAMPIYCFDLTSTGNIIGGNTYQMNPGYRMYYDRTANTVSWRPVFSQAADGSLPANFTKSSVNANATSHGWQVISTQGANTLSPNAYPFAQDYISNIDIKLGFYSARNVPSRFTYDVVTLPDSLCPVNSNDNPALIDNANADILWHNSYWLNELHTFTNHPLIMQKGTRAGAQHTGFWSGSAVRRLFSGPKTHLMGGAKTVNFDPRSTSVQDAGATTGGRAEFRTINMYPERVVDLGYRQRNSNNNVGDGVQKTNTADAVNVTGFSGDYVLSPRPEQRMYLVIKGTDFRNMPSPAIADSPVSGSGATSYYGGKINDLDLTKVNFTDTGSFDLCIVKKCIRPN